MPCDYYCTTNLNKEPCQLVRPVDIVLCFLLCFAFISSATSNSVMGFLGVIDLSLEVHLSIYSCTHPSVSLLKHKKMKHKYCQFLYKKVKVIGTMHLVGTQKFRKSKISKPLIHLCTCAYQELKNVNSLKKKFPNY